MMALSNTQESNDILHLGVLIQREKFRVEIRKDKISNFLNISRFQNITPNFLGEFKLFHERNKDFPSLHVYI